MHVAVGVPGGESAGLAELRLGRGHRETHRDRVAQPAAPVPAFDQRLAVAGPRGRIVTQCFRGIAIHQRLAAHDGLTATLGRGEQRLGRAPVHGGEDDRGGGAVLHESVEEDLGRRACVRLRGVAAFFREREAVQPIQQVLAGRGQHAVLGEVHVGVDEAGQHQRLAVVVDGEAPEPFRQARRVPAPLDAAVHAHRDGAAAPVPNRALRPGDGGIVPVGQDRAENHPRGVHPAHGATRSSMRNRRMRSTFASAAACSRSASLPIRASKAARIASFVAPFTA